MVVAAENRSFTIKEYKLIQSALKTQRNHVKKFRKKLLDVVFLFVLLSKDCGFKMRTCPVGVIWVLWAEKQPFR